MASTDTVSDVLQLISGSMLPETTYGVGQEVESEDFANHIRRCKINLSTILSLLKSNGFNDDGHIPENILIQTILLCGEHSENNSWTDTECIDYANQIIQKILQYTSATNLLSLMLTHKIQSVFSALNSKLLKERWKNYPAATSCFKWIILQIKCPYFEDILLCVLPTCLLMIDDHEIKNKVLGLQCLTHLAKNTSFSDLEQFGRRSLIYSALEHMIYLREPEIINLLASCLIALLCKTDPGCLSTCTKWNHLDDVLNVWLPSMELEQSLALREAYIDSLDQLLQVMGLGVIRWADKLLIIFREYTSTKHTQHKALKTLSTFMDAAWPRIEFHYEEMFTILMKNAINLTHQDFTEQEKQSLQFIKKALSILEDLSKSKYDMVVHQMKENEDLKHFYNFVSNN